MAYVLVIILENRIIKEINNYNVDLDQRRRLDIKSLIITIFLILKYTIFKRTIILSTKDHQFYISSFADDCVKRYNNISNI